VSLEIRTAVETDVVALTDIYNHYVGSSGATFDTEELTVEARRHWLGHYRGTGPYRLLVAVDGGQALGYATSSRFRDRPAYDTSVETSVYVHPQSCGRGIGSSLYTRLFQLLEREDLHRAYAGIALPNDASQALHERFGFRPVGTYSEVGRKFGRFWDVLWMEKPL
jgi:phosphinothricin acetyltransferase